MKCTVHSRNLEATLRATALVNDVAPFIFVNNKDSKAAQLFTLIHEVVHVLFGTSAGVGGEVDMIHDETERYCNRVAAAFLLSNV